MDWLIVLSSLAWVGLLLLPWRPWSTRQRLEPDATEADLSDLTVLIPARNEAGLIGRTCQALATQGGPLRLLLVDDQSSDATAAEARAAYPGPIEVVAGQPLPGGWTGKLWALEQGRRRIATSLVLLLDADIELAPGMVAALKRKLEADQLGLVSVMAELRMQTFWEKLLAPAFVFFFKLLYPFALGNNPRSRCAVAAGGCILLRAAALDAVGGFAAVRGALIDDCALARRVKQAGHHTWMGLSRSVRSHRAYGGLAGFWNMVARCAFTQLRGSLALLLGTSAAMLLVFWLPWAGLASPQPAVRAVALAGLLAMVASYLPTLRYYRRSPLWALALPVVGSLYLLMTWTSAVRCWRGRRAEWKGRVYGPME